MKRLICAGLLLAAAFSTQAWTVSQVTIEQMVGRKLIDLTFDQHGKLIEASCDMSRMTRTQCEKTLNQVFAFYNKKQ